MPDRHGESSSYRDEQRERQRRRSRSPPPEGSERRRREHDQREDIESRRDRRDKDRSRHSGSSSSHHHRHSHHHRSHHRLRVEDNDRHHKSRHEKSTRSTTDRDGREEHRSTSASVATSEPRAGVGRDEWMLPGNEGADGDFFTALGGASRSRPPAKEDKPNPDELRVSSRELNQQFISGKHIDDYDDPSTSSSTAPSITPGGPGSQWRMMKLRRTYEAAEEEGRDVIEVALERYGSMESFDHARSERQFLDDQAQKRGTSSRHAVPSRQSNPVSRQSSFRKPGRQDAPAESRNASVTRSNEVSSSQPSTPIPNVFDPLKRGASISKEGAISSPSSAPSAGPPLSAAALNKLSAKVLRAEMMNAPDAANLRRQFETEKERSNGKVDHGANAQSEDESHIRVLPTLDARGRLYDVGKGESDVRESEKRREGNQSSRSSTTDDQQTLADLVREERFSAGSASQKNMDAQMASQIMNDKSFKNNVDYIDDNVDRLGRQKMKSDALKRMFAVQDYSKTKKALDSCAYCWQEGGDGRQKSPRASIVSSGTRTFLALPDVEPLVPGHCLIVPTQHHLSMLEADEDTVEEVKNFMKCLIQLAASQGKGVVFYETVKSLKHQRHAFIEAVPIEQALFTQLPTYFRQSILDAGDEWSQNKPLVEFTQSRPFRQSMVADLPYFMVQFDHRGERGYGHVIEQGDANNDDDDGFALQSLNRGGADSGGFPRWFGAEIIGSLLDYEPKRWRKPRKLRPDEQQAHVEAFSKQWSNYDWTQALSDK